MVWWGEGRKGKNSSYTELNCDFSTSENSYHIYFEYWFYNEADPDAVGIYSMKICELEVLENTENFDVGWKNPLPGIYYPAWDEKVVEWFLCFNDFMNILVIDKLE